VNKKLHLVHEEPRPIAGRLPPHNLEAERACRSAAMLDAGACTIVLDAMKPEHCYAPAHRTILETITALVAEQQPVDLVTVAARLRDSGKLDSVGGAKYLADLCDCTPSVAPSHLARYAALVEGAARKRAAISMLQSAVAEGYSTDMPADEWLDELEGNVFALRGQRQQKAWTMHGALSECLRSAQERAAGSHGVSWGLREVDRLTGGITAPQLVVVAARPGMGKSALGFGVADAVASSGKGVVVFSLEMSAPQIAGRLLSTRARCSVQELHHGRLTPQEWEHLASSAAQASTLPILIDDSPGLPVEAVRARSRQLASQLRREGHDLGLVVVDYLQLMSGKGEHREEVVSSCSRGLKALAKELSVPVLALSQLNRSVESRASKRPQLSDLRESGAIEQDADTVIFLHRPGYYLEQERKEDTTNGETEAIVAKQRNGPTGSVRVKWYGRTTSFGDWDGEEYER